ncbi:hypothetical protein GCM10022377_08430 [Zhihengliuella alba]|uniref:Uncharacterized protein n=1 Tax=Zhihengliuella alba TaxID=547018 RepID=A0ABP7D0N5_9MICC
MPGRTFGWSFRTRETVWWDTPASVATSDIEGGRFVDWPEAFTPVLTPSLWLMPQRTTPVRRPRGRRTGVVLATHPVARRDPWGAAGGGR